MTAEPIQKPIPCRDDVARRKAIGNIHPDAIPIFVHEKVLEDVLEYSEQDVLRELGGFLLGGHYEDGRPYVEIRNFLPAVDAKSRAASLIFTHETWAHFHRQADANFPGEQIVGWHHTHPNFGVFLSRYDLFIHEHFFSQPWQVALVVDPQRCEFEFFQWRGDKIVDCGFICVQDSQE